MDAKALRRAALITLGGVALNRIQQGEIYGTAWTRGGGRENPRMPLDLSNSELATAAQACRALAYREGERARKQGNPTVRGPIEAASRRYADLAQKLEVARCLRRP
jgi:hypothetical protein